MSSAVWFKIALVIGGVLVGSTLGVMAVLAINYRVTARYLQVTWLRIPIRSVRLDHIRNIGTTPVFWAERWPNTFSVGNRCLVIRKRGWLFRHLIITPKNPFVFRAELVRARERVVKPEFERVPEQQNV
jgi:hypothetical protein